MAKSNENAEDAKLHKEAVAAATAELPPKIVKVSEELSCELNEVEWQNKARELADAHLEVARQEQRKKDITKELGHDVGMAKTKESKLADIVATRRELREVTVEVKYDYELGRVIKTRTDTNEEISNREMTDQERQAQLDLLEDSKPLPAQSETTDANPFDDDEEDDDDDTTTYENLDNVSDERLSAIADELGVDLVGCTVKGDAEATRENVKTVIREEIARRPDVEEAGEIDESELED